MMLQLPLGVRLADASDFDNFLATAENREALAAVRALVAGNGGSLCLAGPAGSGKSHLLQAACRALDAGAASYLPLAQLAQANAAVFEGLEGYALVCVDDVELLAGDEPRETALFVALDAWRDAGCRLLVATSAAPSAAGFGMPELLSRLEQFPRVRLRPLDDAGKAQALRARARLRGFDLGEDAVNYLLARHARSSHELFELLERIDLQSLSRQRRVTVPLLRELLAGGTPGRRG